MTKYLVTYNDIQKVTGQDELFTLVSEKVRDFINEHSGKEMQTYGSGLMYLLPTIQEEIDKQDADLLTRVIENRAEYSLIRNDEQVKVADGNIILYYPKYDIYYVSWNLIGPFRGVEYIYSENGEKVQNFINELIEREKKREKEYITFIYDSPNGQHEEEKKLSEVLNKESIFIDESVKEEIYLSLDTFFNEDRTFFKEYGIPFKRGILLHGPPGNGKTSIVKSIAYQTEHPVIYYQISEFTSSLSLQAVFKKAYTIAPVILVMEDIDGLPPQVRSSFLNILDGATSNEGIFLVGTTNYPNRVDEALINRAGRFDQTFEIKLPNKDMRLKYLLHSKLTNFLKTEDIELAANMTDGFSIVQLKELYTNIVLRKRSDKAIVIKDIVENMANNNKKKKSGNWDKTESNIGF